MEEIAFEINKILSKGPHNENSEKLIAEASEKLTDLVDKFQNIEALRDMLRQQRKLHEEDRSLHNERQREDQTDTEETEGGSFMDGLSVDEMLQGGEMFF